MEPILSWLLVDVGVDKGALGCQMSARAGKAPDIESRATSNLPHRYLTLDATALLV